MSGASARQRSSEPTPPVLRPLPDDLRVTDLLLRPLWKFPFLWSVLTLGCLAGTGLFFFAITWTFTVGIGAWGNNIPVAWAFGITNFVWWIGIGHAGTFISAFLLLLEQGWRTSINRFAEGMTLFAVVIAGLFPILHLGRPWFAYWLIPYPASMNTWPQFKSALTWDVAAVATYLTISFLFWYLGLLPDLAAVRDRSEGKKRRIYGLLAWGWDGSATHWRNHRYAYGLLAGLATPLVVSVHSVVSMDFASANLPGWHSTIFPPYFVAGAIFSGFAMVLTLLVPCRALFGLHDVVTERHLDNIARMVLLMGLIVAYTYAVELFLAWYGTSPYDADLAFHIRPRGIFAPWYWLSVACNVLVPQLFWFRSMRRNPWVLFVGAILINVGMWLERFIIIVASLAQDYLPSSWAPYMPTWVDLSLLGGSLCFFLLMFLLFLRLVPFIPIWEVKELRNELAREAKE